MRRHSARVFAVERTYGFHQEPDCPKLHIEIPDNLRPVLKILAYHPELAPPDAFLTLARVAIGDHATVTRSSPSALLELSGPGVSKASTLAPCCAARGSPPTAGSHPREPDHLLDESPPRGVGLRGGRPTHLQSDRGPSRAGKQGVSSCIEEAVQRQLQREAIDDYIAAAEAEHGPVDPAEVSAKAERIRAHHAAHRGDSAPADAA